MARRTLINPFNKTNINKKSFAFTVMSCLMFFLKQLKGCSETQKALQPLCKIKAEGKKKTKKPHAFIAYTHSASETPGKIFQKY